MRQRTPGTIAAGGIVLLLLATGCRQRPGPPAAPAQSVSAPATIASTPIASSVVLSNATAQAHLKFTHVNGGSGRRYYVETMSGGAAFFDFDGEGWQDVFLVHGAPLLVRRPLP